jgi:hypothetical protein
MIMISSAQISAEAAAPHGLLANPAENKREKNSGSRYCSLTCRPRDPLAFLPQTHDLKLHFYSVFQKHVSIILLNSRERL